MTDPIEDENMRCCIDCQDIEHYDDMHCCEDCGEPVCDSCVLDLYDEETGEDHVGYGCHGCFG